MENDNPAETDDGHLTGDEHRAPLFSVIIPLYNHEKYIREAVDSVLHQTVSDFELIIINDGSQDGSEDVVKGIPDNRIRYYFQENRGAHAAINRGIGLARGRYASILNSDDVFAPNRLEAAADAIESETDIQAVFSHLEIIDENGKTTGHIKGAEENWKEGDTNLSFKDGNNMVLDLLSGNFLTTTSNLFCRKSVFDKIGGFRNFRYAHDYDFFLRLCHGNKARVIDKPLVKYRRHQSNTIDENLPETHFEVGLVLSDFFLRHDLDTMFPGGDIGTDIVRFFNSVKTFNSDRMVMTLLLFWLKHRQKAGVIEDLTSGDSISDLFKNACLDYYSKRIDEWNESREAWRTVSELNERLLQTVAMLDEKHKEAGANWIEAQKAWTKCSELGNMLSETNDRLVETHQALDETKSELAGTEYALSEKVNHINLLLNSKSYRLGRALTWPLRKLARRN